MGGHSERSFGRVVDRGFGSGGIKAMIRTVADLKRALDAYPDDMPIITSGVDGFGEEEIVLADPVRVEEEPMGQDPWAGELPKSFTKAIHAYGSYIRL